MHDTRTIYECAGCGCVTRDPAKQMEIYKAAGKISCCPERKMAALAALALPAAEVKVKPLVWERGTGVLASLSDADTVLGRYEIDADLSRQSSHIYAVRVPGGERSGYHYTYEAAKAAAQADYEARILSARAALGDRPHDD